MFEKEKASENLPTLTGRGKKKEEKIVKERGAYARPKKMGRNPGKEKEGRSEGRVAYY